MRQLTFEVMFEGFIEESIHLEESTIIEYFSQMASAIIEVFDAERRGVDDYLSEQ